MCFTARLCCRRCTGSPRTQRCKSEQHAQHMSLPGKAPKPRSLPIRRPVQATPVPESNCYQVILIRQQSAGNGYEHTALSGQRRSCAQRHMLQELLGGCTCLVAALCIRQGRKVLTHTHIHTHKLCVVLACLCCMAEPGCCCCRGDMPGNEGTGRTGTSPGEARSRLSERVGACS